MIGTMKLRSAVLAVALSLCAGAQAAAGDKVVLVPNGPHSIRLAGKEVLAVRAWRENFNAHGFDTVTLFVNDGGVWQVMPVMYPAAKGAKTDTDERIEIGASGGADCQLRDFRLVQPAGGKGARLVVGAREFGESFADAATVHFDYYDLTENTDEEVGDPRFYFKHVKRVDATKKYCDVNEAFDKELHLGPGSGARKAGDED